MHYYKGNTTAYIYDVDSDGIIRIPIDLQITSPCTVELANAICARYDAGIIYHIREHTGVLEYDTR